MIVPFFSALSVDTVISLPECGHSPQSHKARARMCPLSILFDDFRNTPAGFRALSFNTGRVFRLIQCSCKNLRPGFGQFCNSMSHACFFFTIISVLTHVIREFLSYHQLRRRKFCWSHISSKHSIYAPIFRHFWSISSFLSLYAHSKFDISIFLFSTFG